ncbi:MAG TPA: glycosyltransferase [Chloroflexota bacterium]|jgi:UDP-N-acetylglucosamine:LPS N-acetylglucosamine transferase|nr:glycosyltransferase [Chloroflexota bacterium]
MSGPRILILTSRTGGGHGRVAQTLERHLLALNPACEINVVDGLEKTDLGLHVDPARAFLTLTTTLIRLYNLLYNLTNKPLTVPMLRRFIRTLHGSKLADAIHEFAPDVVVTTHHFLSPTTVSADQLALPPFAMVVSDLGLPHRLWFDRRLEAVYVPSEDMVGYARRCLGSAAESTRVEMLGFPIESGPTGSSVPAPADHGLLVMGGGAGTGSLDRLVDILSRGLPQHRIVVVCGHNRRVQNTIAGWRRPNIEVHGFVDNVPELMAGSDMVISKAGPVTIMEAAAAGRPLVITSWVGIQEKDNVEFVVRHGLGLYCDQPQSLCDAVLRVYDRYAEFMAARTTNVERGPDRIAASILELWRKPVDEKRAVQVLSSERYGRAC